MAEYVDREAIKSAIRKRVNNSLIISWLISIVNTIPAAEVAPVVHGRWNFDAFTAKHGNPYRCSCCKEEYADMFNYCPNCGARMDGE